MFNLLITNSDLFDKMYQEINRQNTFYFWIIGIVVAVSVAIAAFIGVLQWRLSDKQIQKMKDSTKQELEEKYHFRETINEVSRIDKSLEELGKKVDKLNQNMSDSNQKLNNADQGKINAQIQRTLNAQLQKSEIESQATLLASMDESPDSKRLAAAIQRKIEKLKADGSFESMIGSLSTTYNILNSSNNKSANSLAAYLKDKYPADTYFIKVDNI